MFIEYNACKSVSTYITRRVQGENSSRGWSGLKPPDKPDVKKERKEGEK
jgi:hypothetical protein